MQIGTTIIESAVEFPRETKNKTITLLGIHQKEVKLSLLKYVCTPTYTATLLRIVKIRKQHKCPSMEVWIKIMISRSMNQDNARYTHIVCMCVCACMYTYVRERERETYYYLDLKLQPVICHNMNRMGRYILNSQTESKNLTFVKYSKKFSNTQRCRIKQCLPQEGQERGKGDMQLKGQKRQIQSLSKCKI